MLKICK